MGTIWHESAVVTGWRDEVIEAIHKRAVELLGERVTPITTAVTNGYRSFLIASSGSKLGWAECEAHRANLATLLRFVRTFEYEDGSSSVSWACVRYGGDWARNQRLSRSSIWSSPMPNALPTAQTAAAPESIFPIRERDDHMDEALASLQTALIFTTDPIARRQIENARAHLAAYNAWHVSVEQEREAQREMGI